MKTCTCPEAPEHLGCYHDPDCPLYTSCGGWTWDPPCGACDWCCAAQDAHARMLRDRSGS